METNIKIDVKSTNMRKLIYAFLFFTTVIAVIASGCMGSSEPGPAETAVPTVTAEPTAVNPAPGLVLIDPDSMAMETRFKYDDKTGKAYTSSQQQEMNTMAVWLMKTQEKNDYYFGTTSLGGSGSLERVLPASGNKFIFVTVRASVLKGYAYSPPHWDFSLTDQDGNIYAAKNVLCEDYEGREVSLLVGDEPLVYEHNVEISNLYKIQDLAKIYVQLKLPYNENDNQQAVIVFEVPENCNRDYSYVNLDLAISDAKWSLAPVHCTVSVTKDQFGKVKAVFQGGSGVDSIRSITLRVYKDDGSTEDTSIEPLVNAEGEIQGTKGVENRVQVIVNHYSGSQFLVYDQYVKSRTYM